MPELWDAYDRQLNLIDNITLIRGENLPDGVYHLVCDVIVQHTDGTYLLMQRDFCKPMGGKWELTAGGSAIKGEDPENCGIRELFEETGVRADKLIEIGRYVRDDRNSYHIEYLCTTDCHKESVVLQEGETIGYRWVDYATMLAQRDELATEKPLEYL